MISTTKKEFMGFSEKDVIHGFVYRKDEIENRRKKPKECKQDKEIDVEKVFIKLNLFCIDKSTTSISKIMESKYYSIYYVIV